MFQKIPVKILYCYRHWQSVYSQLEKELKDKIQFMSNIPSEQELTSRLDDIKMENSTETDKNPHVVLCVDDWMDEIYKNKLFLDLVTRIGHHHNLTNIFLVQDAKLGGPMKREILNNIHVNVFMASSRDRSSIRNMGIMMGDFRCIMDAFEDCSKKGRGSYLMVVTHPAADSQLKYRTNIFPGDQPGPIIYKSKKI